MNGGYIFFTTSSGHVKVEIIEAKNDSVLYETFIPPRNYFESANIARCLENTFDS